MNRPAAVVALALLAVASGLLALSKTAPRGVVLRVFDNHNGTGEPAETRTVRHLDFGPDHNKNPLQLADRTSATIEGWLHAPRGGTYEFVVESPDDVWFRLDGKPTIAKRTGSSNQSAQVRLVAGFHHLSVQIKHGFGPSPFAVKWRLPSGYMSLTPLPPVVLQPVPPGTVAPVPRALRLAPLVFAVLALLVALWPRLRRAVRLIRLDAAHRARVAIGLYLVLFTLGVRLYDLSGAGETSDEWAYASAGRIYVSNIAHGYIESAYWHTNEEHPPIGKFIYGLVSHLAGTNDYTPLRATAAVFSALTVLVTFLFGVRFLDLWSAVFGALVLALLPQFVAHAKVAALDAPTGLLFTLAVHLFVTGLYAKERVNRIYLLAGVVASLAFATKFSNVLLLVFLFVLHFLSQWRNVVSRGRIEVPLGVYVMPFLPPLLLLASWPWLWREPFGQLVTTLKHWSYPIQEWFLGTFRQPPWYYFPVYLAATTPVLLLGAFGSFVWRAWRHRAFTDLVLILWFLTPFVWTLSVLKQDGVRYIYTAFPPMALMIGAGLHWALPQRRHVRPVMAALTTLYLGVQCWRVHPYYLDYYGELVGGTSTVYKHSLFEVGWWGEGLDAAYRHVNEVAPHGASFDCVGVVNHTTDALRRDITYEPNAPDYLIKGYLTPGQESVAGYTEEMRVVVDGVPIAIVYHRDSTR